MSNWLLIPNNNTASEIIVQQEGEKKNKKTRPTTADTNELGAVISRIPTYSMRITLP